jgi:hypothetical protein
MSGVLRSVSAKISSRARAEFWDIFQESSVDAPSPRLSTGVSGPRGNALHLQCRRLTWVPDSEMSAVLLTLSVECNRLIACHVAVHGPGGNGPRHLSLYL